ncbi:alpha/beta hydrolase family protein [Thermomonospora umbrina]|uniref:Poly(ethylene terephthalate) hydrolase n=1 Tax=Thermomonospora umbrina TaxID=111806 RepID=A0A3D9SRX0_9ACTN|nr:dienelactone hydrolase family protein [Thermomonospora umbrina]REE98709.1 dienelactone hydrolase family protein [Thermomonospora umbrina]
MKFRLKMLPAAFALLAGVAVAAPAESAQRAASPYERGPAPTEQSVSAKLGPFAFTQVPAPANASAGFNQGTVYYPNDTGQGTFGAIAITPGFISPESSIAWLGPRLASNGFVVITLTTNTGFDQPNGRADQMKAALDWLVKESPTAVRQRIDPTRLGVMGWSMGGGGTLDAAETHPNIQAAIPLAPWHTDKDWSTVKVPTMIIGAQNDFIAGVGAHSEPFYESLKSAPERAYAEIKGGNHFSVTTDTPLVGKLATSWMKRFIDDDTRYDQFLCPKPTDSTLSEYRDTCPHA